jgi:hypothetical protein
MDFPHREAHTHRFHPPFISPANVTNSRCDILKIFSSYIRKNLRRLAFKKNLKAGRPENEYRRIAMKFGITCPPPEIMITHEN